MAGAYISDANTINDEMAMLQSSDTMPDPVVFLPCVTRFFVHNPRKDILSSCFTDEDTEA